MFDRELNEVTVTTPDIRILHCDDDLIIVDKPVNSVVHGKTPNALVLLDALHRQMASNGWEVSFLAPSNRLDRNTSGPVVFSRNRDTAVILRRLFARCMIEKTYHAILRGCLNEPLFIQVDIIRSRHRRASVADLQIIRNEFPEKQDWFNSRAANSATISGTVIEPLKTDDNRTLAAIHPWTGRFHQIRAVCQSIGMPIQGDKKYMKYPLLETGTGSDCRRKSQRTEWSLPALICKNLAIPSMNIAVESRFSLDL